MNFTKLCVIAAVGNASLSMETFCGMLKFLRTQVFRRKVPREEQEISTFDVGLNVAPITLMEVDTRNLALGTWPPGQLENTLKDILLANGTEMGNEDFNRSLTAILDELDDKCPFQLSDQYDFCIICASDDYHEAQEFKEDIESKFVLVGYMVSEAVSLGRDLFEAYEDVVERSSKVIFYMTENFSNDEVCCHLARNTFIAPSEETRKKCIPIVDDFSTTLPDSMVLVEKLVKSNKFHIDLRLRAVFDDSVRKERDERVLKEKEKLDTARLEMLKRILVDLNSS